MWSIRLPDGAVVRAVDYSFATEFCAMHHRHLPKIPPRIQVALCVAIGGRRTHAVMVIGQPVSPHHSRTCLEVRRMISDGRMHGACSTGLRPGGRTIEVRT